MHDRFASVRLLHTSQLHESISAVKTNATITLITKVIIIIQIPKGYQHKIENKSEIAHPASEIKKLKIT